MPTEIEQLYRKHRAGLVRLVERELHDRNEAEDAVQTAFLDAQRALERGTIPRNPAAWLAAIALNAGRRLRRRHQNAEPLEDYAVHEAAEIPEIRAALASLPREQRTAVVYRDVLGLSYVETATEMGVTVNAVTMLIHRGRRRLREILGAAAPGVGLWRWLKRAGVRQVTVGKGAAAVVATGCLATTGVVVARVAAPIGSGAAAAAATRPTDPASSSREAGRGFGGAPVSDSTPRRRAVGSSLGTVAGPTSVASPSTQSSTSRATAETGPPSEPSPTTEGAPSLLPSTLSLPTVSAPTLSIPTVAATVAVGTPVATVTVTTPTIPATTVTAPIVTVTVPIP